MKRLDDARIRGAIEAAEAETTGKIAVRLIGHDTPDALQTAKEQLEKAGLHHHPHRNAIIFLVAPTSRKFAVYGDHAIHQRVGEGFWNDVVAEMTPYFQRDDPTTAVLTGIARAGQELRKHFPRSSA